MKIEEIRELMLISGSNKTYFGKKETEEGKSFTNNGN